MTDHSVAGQWRLPTIAEWQATIAQAVALGCFAFAPNGVSSPPSLTNEDGIGAFAPGGVLRVRPVRGGPR